MAILSKLLFVTRGEVHQDLGAPAILATQGVDFSRAEATGANPPSGCPCHHWSQKMAKRYVVKLCFLFTCPIDVVAGWPGDLLSRKKKLG